MNKKLDRKKQKQVHRYVRAIIQLIEGVKILVSMESKSF